ncbi:O-methyltransferase family protein [Coniochaeta ligniaria NRRL 30616]|uniref:O-methyltransferase family protein n=1 Tax=Coniochaeta ligniaria NRRL 30616 TaxID=1408157 RepID=A0A1J7JDG7_9PEZI|nr:O-methyltransferase family protein [Coniochaeta ligniaria NRRL 30616]
MINTGQLEECVNGFVRAANTLKEQCQDTGDASDATPETTRARRDILAATTTLQSLLFQPIDFLQHLATKTQQLACLQWLGEFHVLAYIPLSGSVSITDVADLADVPDAQLRRVVRLMAMGGFLREPVPGFVEHTPMSAGFVNRPVLLDSAMFLAETAAPSALRMAAVTRGRQEKVRGHLQSDEGSGDSSHSLPCIDEQTSQPPHQPPLKSQRHRPAFFRCIGDMSHGSVELLSQLNWASLGNACVVDVGGQSIGSVVTLAKLYSALHFIVQTEESTSPTTTMTAISSDADLSRRISTRKRASGTPQTVQPAAVYLVRLWTHNQLTPIRSRITVELRAHIGVLEANRSALLILMVQLLPDPSAVDSHTECMARVRDLSLLQLVNDGYLEEPELINLVDSVQDEKGRLIVIKTLRCHNSAEVAVGIKYQSDGNMKQQLAFMPDTI